MKFPVRFALLLLTATLLLSCVAAPVDLPATNSAPVSLASRGAAITATPHTPTIPAPATVLAARPAPTQASLRALDPAHDSTDWEHQAAQDLRALHRATAAPNSVARVSKPGHPLEGAELYMHLPPHAKSRQPLRVFLVLHGMGNRGEVFSQNLLKIAEANNWVLIAPTFQYRDYLDPQQLREDDIQLSKRILDTLEVLPQRLNLKLYRQVLIYGYSRGAQLAHRFAYFYPERVKSVAVLSAGAYTLPTEKVASAKGTQVVPFPYGVGDLQECVGSPINWHALKQISFWVGVGERDNYAGDVARAFDAYGGKTRVERAQSFKQALQNIGIDVYLVIFPNASHEMTPEMRVGALQFLRSEELADPLDD